jgi:hypothetical protein
MKSFVLVARMGFVVAWLPSCVIYLVSIRAITIAGQGRCAGHETTRGFPTAGFFLFFCVISALWLAIIGILAWGRGRLFTRLLGASGLPPVKFLFMQFPHDVFAAYFWLLTMILSLCVGAGVTTKFYEPISADCRAQNTPVRSPSSSLAVSAEIITGDRRVIDYILSPILRYRHEAGRER